MLNDNVLNAATIIKENLIETLTFKHNRAKESVDKFIIKLQQNPYALTWGDSTFEESAKVAVFGEVLSVLRNPNTKATLQTLETYALEQALRVARDINQSTSVCSNLMDRCVAKAWHDVYQIISGNGCY